MAGAIDIAAIAALAEEAGRIALDWQERIDFRERERKEDDSFVTEADRRIDDFLHDRLIELFPDANVITEEHERSFERGRAFTFIIDPIDGTDNYSQGIFGWSIAVGILGSDMLPLAGVLYAPAMRLMITSDGSSRARVNGQEVEVPLPIENLTGSSQLAVASKIHRSFSLRNFPGKLRATGSSALNVALPALYHGVVGAIQDDETLAWDITASHAICKSVGYELRYLDGRPLDYRSMAENGWRVEDFIVASSEEAFALIVDCMERY